jgi:hypothetical protein
MVGAVLRDGEAKAGSTSTEESSRMACVEIHHAATM